MICIRFSLLLLLGCFGHPEDCTWEESRDSWSSSIEEAGGVTILEAVDTMGGRAMPLVGPPGGGEIADVERRTGALGSGLNLTLSPRSTPRRRTSTWCDSNVAAPVGWEAWTTGGHLELGGQGEVFMQSADPMTWQFLLSASAELSPDYAEALYGDSGAAAQAAVLEGTGGLLILQLKDMDWEAIFAQSSFGTER